MNRDREILLIYDKECPVCDYYCLRVRMEESVGKLALVNARDPSTAMDEITALGWDVDQGMVLKLDDSLYYGSDAIHMLSLLGTRSGMFNRFNYRLFRSRRSAGVWYPLLRGGRNLLLKLLGKTKINNLRISGNDRF